MRMIVIAISGMLIVSTAEVVAAPRAMRQVSTVGTVWINAAALPSGSTLYNGDTIATAQNGFALITCPGQDPPRANSTQHGLTRYESEREQHGRVEVRQDSLVSVAAEEIMLKAGVVASDGLPVRLGSNVIRPEGDSETRRWFVVADRDGQKLVAAHKGNVLIAAAGGEPIIVPAGSYAVPDSASSKDPDDAKLPGGIPGAKAKNGWMIFSFTGTGVALLVSLGATAALATMLGLTLADEPVSPSK